jgi:hypothetical protein
MSSPDFVSSSKTGVNAGIRGWKKHSSGWASCLEAIDGIYFTKKWRAETLQPDLEFDNFKPRLESGIFKSISQLNGSFYGGDDDRGFLKETVKTCQLFSCPHIYSLCFDHLCIFWSSDVTISRNSIPEQDRENRNLLAKMCVPYSQQHKFDEIIGIIGAFQYVVYF